MSADEEIAMLIEHLAGKWPFWLSPRQAVVVPVYGEQLEYGRAVRDELWRAGFEVDLDSSDNSLAKKIREAQLAQYNFILVVGPRELETQTLNVRARDNAVHRQLPLSDLRAEFDLLTQTHR